MKLKNQKGITLVALVVTILIILLLAVIVIRTVTESNLIDRTKTAALEHELKSEDEKAKIAYVHDENGKIDFEATKANLSTALNPVQMSDSSGDFPIIAYVEGKYGKYYKITVNKDSVESEIVDELSKKEIEDVAVAWLGAGSSDSPSDAVIPVVIVKTSKTTDAYPEAETVTALNDFFKAQFNLYQLINYLDTNENYGIKNPEWINNLNSEEFSENDKDELEDIVEGLYFAKGYYAEESVQSEGQDNQEQATEEKRELDFVKRAYEAGLLTNGNKPIEFNSLDDFMNFLNTHKDAYYGMIQDYTMMMNEDSSSSSDSYYDSSSSNNNDTEEILEMIKGIIDDLNFSSTENMYQSLEKYDSEEIGAPEGFNKEKSTLVNMIGQSRLKKAINISSKVGIDALKSYGAYLSIFRKLNDSTINGYLDNLFVEYAGPNMDEVVTNLQTNGDAVVAKFYQGNYNVKINDTVIPITKLSFGEDNYEAILTMGLVNCLGVFPVMDESVQLTNLPEKITISVGDFTATRTKDEWSVIPSVLGD